jgi:hypothetical protein
VGTDAIPSLIVAAADLKLVQLLRAAMNTGGNGCCGKSAHPLGPDPNCNLIERRFRIEPEPEILPRKRIEPQPRIEPRQVIRPVDRFEPRECDLMAVPVPVECYSPGKKCPIEPPWRVLPWEHPLSIRVEAKVKVVVRPPDIVNKGTLIDFFI